MEFLNEYLFVFLVILILTILRERKHNPLSMYENITPSNPKDIGDENTEEEIFFMVANDTKKFEDMV